MKIDFVAAENNRLYVRVDLKVYSLPALLRVAHKFTGQCYLHLQSETDHLIAVRFRSRKPEADISPIVGQFMNELLDQTLRDIVQQETEGVRNLILAHALSETSLLHPELESLEPAEDTLRLSVPDNAK